MTERPRVNPRGLAFAIFAAWIALAVGMASLHGAGLFFLVLAAGALLLAIWFFWRSVQGLSQDSPLTLEEALGMAAPSKEEERKQSVLRILKDLDYERAVGKLEEKDFHELSERYRAEARALLSNLEEGLGPARERAEDELRKRLGAAHVEGPTASSDTSIPSTSASSPSSEPSISEQPAAQQTVPTSSEIPAGGRETP